MADILDHNATLVACAIDVFRDRATAPTVREVAKVAFCSVAVAHRAIHELDQAGLLMPRIVGSFRTLRLRGRFVWLEDGDVA